MLSPNLSPSQLLPPLPQKTNLVTFTVKVNNQPVPDAVMVKNIAVSHAANRIPIATLTIMDGEVSKQTFASSDIDLFSPGNTIEILAGYHRNNNTIFKGIIIRHSVNIPQKGASHLEVECKDESIKLTAGRKNKYFYNTFDHEIIDQILRRTLPNGQHQADATAVKHKEMVQYFATDWDFIISRAEANGMLVFANQGSVTVKKPDFIQSEKFPLNYGTSIFEFEAEMDARDQYPTAKVTSWDPTSQAQQVADPGGTGGSGLSTPATKPNASAANLAGTPPNTDYSGVLGITDYPLQHAGRLTPEEAQHWARAQMVKCDLARSKGRVKFDGTADIKPGECLTLQGVGQRHSGKVYVTAVTHEIGEGKWFTHAQFGLSQRWFTREFDDVTEVPASGLLPALHGLQVGIVTKLQDPDAEDRIQVRLPMVDPQGQGFWTRLAAQDAGNSRGAVWRPEINDEVVVGFFNDDPRQSVILGKLHSDANPAPIAADDKNHEKGWVTRSKMKMVFNDDNKSLILETPNGKKITIDEKADVIRLEDEHQNKIVMDKNGIVIESGKDLTLKAAKDILMEGINVQQKAQATYKAESQGQAQIKATADVVVQGTFVRIN